MRTSAFVRHFSWTFDHREIETTTAQRPTTRADVSASFADVRAALVLPAESTNSDDRGWQHGSKLAVSYQMCMCWNLWLDTPDNDAISIGFGIAKITHTRRFALGDLIFAEFLPETPSLWGFVKYFGEIDSLVLRARVFNLFAPRSSISGNFSWLFLSACGETPQKRTLFNKRKCSSFHWKCGLFWRNTHWQVPSEKLE